MCEVVAWLKSPEGFEWACGHFSMEPTDCHDMIEIHDDTDCAEIADHMASSSRKRLDQMREYFPEWADLHWTPDQDPTRV